MCRRIFIKKTPILFSPESCEKFDFYSHVKDKINPVTVSNHILKSQ